MASKQTPNMTVITKEDIYEIERELLKETSIWDYDTGNGIIKIAYFIDGIHAMTEEILKYIESVTAERK